VAIDQIPAGWMGLDIGPQTIEKISAIEKKDRSPVTLADFGSQAIINMALQKAFPKDPIIGEETAEALVNDSDLGRQVLELVKYEGYPVTLNEIITAIDYGAHETDFKARFWTLDPIDGTKGFIRGDQYAVALALVENGEVVLGVLGCPNLPAAPDSTGNGIGCVLHAVKGNAAWIRRLSQDADNPVFVDAIVDTTRAKFCESFEKAHASHETHHKISESLKITADPLRMDSQVKYAAIARGDASIYLRLPRGTDYQEKIWDHAAGAIIVEEAGGRVTDFKGMPLDFSAGRKLLNNRGIVATNGHLHPKILEAISQVVKNR